MSTDVASLLSHSASMESCSSNKPDVKQSSSSAAAAAAAAAYAATNEGAAIGGSNDDDDDDDVQIVFITCLTCGNVASQQPGRRKKTICPFCGNFYDMDAANAARSGGGGGGGGRDALPAIKSLDARPKVKNLAAEDNSQGERDGVSLYQRERERERERES